MESKMESAVEWLVEYLTLHGIELNNDAIQNVINQAKEMEKEQNYSIHFIMWYSGMDKEKIENAHKRWYNETFKSE